jgi:starvation-inducible DNA-binding protein
MNTKNQKVVELLNSLLANYQIYYQNLRGLHWNIKGAQFFALHEKYESYYNEAAEVVDEVAERILMLGGQPLHTFGDYVKHATLREVSNVSDGQEGVKAVLENSRVLLGQFREILALASEHGDEATLTLMSELIGVTEKRIWMLESFLA